MDNLKRILTAIVGLPLVALIIIFGNKYVIDAMIMIIAIICMHEYLEVIKKVAHPIKWVGYATTILTFLPAVVSNTYIINIAILMIPVVIMICFLKVIITNMKTNFKDVAYTLLGICYISIFMMFLSLLISEDYGKYLFAYAIIIAWTTDIFAFLVGRRFGKHHFSEVSKGKTVEGCIAGAIGAAVIGTVFLVISMNAIINVSTIIFITLISLILSIISQIGDFTASSIKRFVDTKDFGSLLPGHGGMLDRIDSLIFIAPFIYFIFTYILQIW